MYPSECIQWIVFKEALNAYLKRNWMHDMNVSIWMYPYGCIQWIVFKEALNVCLKMNFMNDMNVSI